MSDSEMENLIDLLSEPTLFSALQMYKIPSDTLLASSWREGPVVIGSLSELYQRIVGGG